MTMIARRLFLRLAGDYDPQIRRGWIPGRQSIRAWLRRGPRRGQWRWWRVEMMIKEGKEGEEEEEEEKGRIDGLSFLLRMVRKRVTRGFSG